MDTLALLATIIGPLALLGAYLYGRHQGWKTADTELRKQISESLRKEFERQVRVQTELRQAIEQDLIIAQEEVEKLKEKAHQHEIESLNSPDANDTGLSAERVQRLNKLKSNTSPKASGSPSTSVPKRK